MSLEKDYDNWVKSLMGGGKYAATPEQAAAASDAVSQMQAQLDAMAAAQKRQKNAADALDAVQRAGAATAENVRKMSSDLTRSLRQDGLLGGTTAQPVNTAPAPAPTGSFDGLADKVRAQVLGQDIVHQAAQVKSMIAVSPQETAVAGNLTVRENLELMAGVYGHSAAECRALTHEMMDRLRLNEVANQRAKTLSGGWMRRLSIDMALVSSPRVLFLDEPTLGLDVLTRRELWSVIRSLRGHTALVLTTHYLEEAEALSDRIGIMSHGHLIALGTAQELIEKTGESSFENAFIALAGEGDAAK